MLDYRIDTFLSLCKTKNYTQTAKELNITQPAVSQHIRSLEHYYNVKLVNYEKRQLYLTPEGEFLFQEMTKINSLSKSVNKKIREINGSENYSKIVFVSNMTMGEYMLPKLVREYNKIAPNHKLCSYIASGNRMEELLKNGMVDYAIVDAYAIPDGMEKELFAQDSVYCICNPKHPLAGKTVSLSEIQKQNIIFRERNAAANNVIRHILAHHGYNWDDFYISMEVGSMFAIEQYLREIEGISFMYEVASRPAIEEGRLARIYVPELVETIDYYFVFPNKECLSDDARSFMEFAKNEVISSALTTHVLP